MAESTTEAVALAGLKLDESTSSSTTRPTPASCARSATCPGLRPDRVIDSIAELGNTSAATIPLALAEAKRTARAGAESCSAPDVGATVIEWGGAVSVGV